MGQETIIMMWVHVFVYRALHYSSSKHTHDTSSPILDMSHNDSILMGIKRRKGEGIRYAKKRYRVSAKRGIQNSKANATSKPRYK